MSSRPFPRLAPHVPGGTPQPSQLNQGQARLSRTVAHPATAPPGTHHTRLTSRDNPGRLPEAHSLKVSRITKAEPFDKDTYGKVAGSSEFTLYSVETHSATGSLGRPVGTAKP